MQVLHQTEHYKSLNNDIFHHLKILRHIDIDTLAMFQNHKYKYLYTIYKYTQKIIETCLMCPLTP